MAKLAFIGNSEHPQKLLETFKKMTPGRSGVWGQLQGTGNIEEADYFAVIDYLPDNLRGRVNESKCIFLGAHPETLRAYRDMSGYKGLKMFDCKHTLGFLEWWIAYDYDYLSQLKPMAKQKMLGTIVSNSSSDASHATRKEFLQRICAKHPTILDVYGRIIPTGSVVPCYRGPLGQAAPSGQDYWSGKEPVYEQYKYMIEFDNVGEHYFSERVLDCMLLWAMPIYWGGRGVHRVLPQNSFRYLDIDGSGDDVHGVINSTFYEEHINDLAAARDMLLNQVQVWAKVHHTVYGTYK